MLRFDAFYTHVPGKRRSGNHSRLLLDKSKKRKERVRLLDVPHDDGDMINV
jgi:hypothetical protein